MCLKKESLRRVKNFGILLLRRYLSKAPAEMDVFFAGMMRSGTTVLCDIFTIPGKQIILIEPGIHRDDMGKHVFDQLKLVGIPVVPKEFIRRKGESAQDLFERAVLHLIAGKCYWGVKEVNLTGWQETYKHYRPKYTVMVVRDLRDVALSAMEKARRQEVDNLQDFNWHHDRIASNVRHLIDICETQNHILVRYEDFFTDPNNRYALAARIGASADGKPGVSAGIFNRDYERLNHGEVISRKSIYRWKRQPPGELLDFAMDIWRSHPEYAERFGYRVD